MPKIVIDGQEIHCREGIPVLQAALEAGRDVPHYCYHPGLSIVASCRLCLMEMKMPDPKTKEVTWSPKLFPSCQTPVKEGLEVRFSSDAVRNNQEHCMEYFLVNHPLDCPVCDQAGECYLQDYSQKFGHATSRAVDAKIKNPKKDIGPRTLLYQDRCVMCSRCVRFTQEVSGTSELCIVNRGNKAEIDVFPGIPLDNNLQGNVVDVCPVGSLLDKDFLFEQRVWFLKRTDSVCPGCSTGCAIHVDQNQNQVYRLKPRFNPGVNDWWMCDEGRFGWKFVHDPKRITVPAVRRGGRTETPAWESLAGIIRQRFELVMAKHGTTSVAVQLSPEMACEEAWLLATFVRKIAPEAALVVGDARVSGEDQHFPCGTGVSPVNGEQNSETPAPQPKFTVRAEKSPNRLGIEMVVKGLGGPTVTHEELWSRTKEFKAIWLAGGYPAANWPTEELVKAAQQCDFLVVQDIFPNALTQRAEIVLPFGAWLEREGCFVNHQGKIQPFERAILSPEANKRDGQYLYEMAGFTGLYNAQRVREMMAKTMPQFAELHVPPLPPEHAH